MARADGTSGSCTVYNIWVIRGLCGKMENLGVFRGIIVLQGVSGMSRGAIGSALEEKGVV